MLELQLDDVLRLRKPHPCGGYEWRVVRLGADIGLQCLTCDRRVLLTRREVEKRTKTLVERAAASAPNSPDSSGKATERQNPSASFDPSTSSGLRTSAQGKSEHDR
jgi:hypothetical protein